VLGLCLRGLRALLRRVNRVRLRLQEDELSERHLAGLMKRKPAFTGANGCGSGHRGGLGGS
jgi:hypothetical protein